MKKEKVDKNDHKVSTAGIRQYFAAASAVHPAGIV